MASNTDVVGMGSRADGGGLGQDSGLSIQLKRILTAKLPLLNSPGTVIENSLYYDTSSSTVHAVEMQATFSKDRISFNQLNLGSSATAYIPSVLFAGNAYWVAQFNPNATIKDLIKDGVMLPEGYGFDQINSIVVYLGASSVAQVQISGKTNFMIAMATCETQEKKRAVLHAAGKYVCTKDNAKYIAVGGEVAYQGDYSVFNTGMWYNDQYNFPAITVATDPAWKSQLATFAVPLRLPWTSMAALAGRLSFDTKLCTQPIQVVLEYKSRDSCVSFKPGSTEAFQTQFSQYGFSTLQCWQEELIDKSLSVRNELLAMPEFNVGWPFQYIQSIPFNVGGTETDSGDTNQEFRMNLSSIINADLTTFLFMVSSNFRNNARESQINYNPLYGERLFQIELQLNGQRFFSFNDDVYPGVFTSKLIGAPTVSYSQLSTSLNAGSNDFWEQGGGIINNTTRIYEFNNSKLRAICNEASLQNTCRFTNQTFQIVFKVDRNINWGFGSDAATSKAISVEGFVLHMAYLYNGVFLIGGDGGTTKLITN